MIKHSLKNFNGKDKNAFIEMIPYMSPKIYKYEVEEECVKVFCKQNNEDEIKDKLRILENLLRDGDDTELEVEIIEDYTQNIPSNDANVFEQLLERGDVRELAKGSFAYAGLFLKVLQYFDKKIDEFGFLKFEGIRKETYPDLYSVKEYAKGRYFENFPHYMMFQTELKNDVEIYEKFSNCRGDISCILDEIKTPENVLRHAACAPLYPSLENKIIEKNKSKSFIVSGKCFRNEETNLCELSRLNEFYMKEFVFVGDENSINRLINESKELVRYWIKRFHLNSKCETANDSFFASNYKKLKFFQFIGNSKQEFKVLIPHTSKYISVCSANYHRTHFSKSYQIKDSEGNYCYSACFAFGLERLAYSFLSQKGLDYKKWGDEIIEELSRYVEIGE